MSDALLSLGDIARLAKVARPVVSTWRQRPRARTGTILFPAPVVTEPYERFRAGDVIDWLARTGRGNNPDAAIEVALLRVGQDALRDRSDQLAALVTLRSLIGAPLAGHASEDLIDLADEFDPDDECLFREVEGAGAELQEIAATADDLCEAAFGPAGALDHLTRPSALELAPPGRRLISALLANWVALQTGPVLLAGLESSAQLTAALLATLPEDAEISALITDPSARWLRRHLVTRAIPVVTRGSAPVVRLLATDGLSPTQLLDRIDELQLELRPGDVGLVLGPSATLIDRLPSSTMEALRDNLLRLGALRHVVHLPAGLNAKAPRQHLAVWVLAAHTEAIPPAQRWLLASDMSGQAVDDAAITHLVGDVMAGLEPPRQVASHAFATAQIVSLPALIAGRGPLVAPGTRPRRLADQAPSSGRAEQVLETRSVLAALSHSRPPRFTRIHVGLPAQVTTHRRVPGELVTIEALLHEGNLRVIPGTRLDLDRLADGSVDVLTSDDVVADAGTSPRARAGVDPLDLARCHPRARRVEEGDVVFVTAARPAAVVCREPGAVVAYPARVLRILSSELVPEVVAALINALPETDKRWRGWAFPRADHTADDALTGLLRAIEDERADLATRHTQLDQLTHLLTGGSARGTLSITIEGDD